MRDIELARSNGVTLPDPPTVAKINPPSIVMEKAPSESQSRILSLPSITINPVPKMDIKSADMVQKGDSSLQLDVNNIKMKVRQ
jgi:hypothetical protein